VPSGLILKKKLYTVPALHWVFCTDLRTDNDFCFIHH